ncbi:hypothetical protein BH772_gp010 [Gordonia phage Bachita]|uniref:Uncharacterized protein n=1 Tax=Gordonia phage Bachita TaxID=1838061 RepID=A0A160DFI7_9CAUD|nr:hypothetical protein BH772_gp010 [Gordonia phage Bachita]ANA86695.1 hypothetical protein PBI_BACHITA_10 [Gordonia phage Bachita]WKW85815.1 hypothetical protein SEA_PHINKBODEN_10 [Gordonia Phage PhinkBoden]WNM66288.1 hypothetical protein SEA_CULVER_8 [Gordonia phage Culver]
MTSQALHPVFEGFTPDGDVLVAFRPSAASVQPEETSYQSVHVVPLSDPDNPHVASEDCHCFPRIGMETSENSVFWVIRHGSAKDRDTPLGIRSV